MEANEVRESLVELLGDKSKRSRIIIDQLCELWQKWIDHKDESEPQRFYMAMAALKQFNAIYLKIEPDALKPSLPKVSTRNRQAEQAGIVTRSRNGSG